MNRRSTTAVGAACAVALLVVLSACEAVPSLTFEGEDAGGSVMGGQCPASMPQNATCCGPGNTVPCYGNYCSGTNCTTGCSTCSPPDVCCSKNATNVVCLPTCK